MYCQLCKRAQAERGAKKLIDGAAAALWTGTGSPPDGWIEFRLCKLYNCRPSELTNEDYDTMIGHLQLEQLERKISRQGK